MMHDGSNVGARLVDRAVDEALGIRRPACRIDRRAVGRELHQVLDVDALGRARARHDVSVRAIGMADADVPERIGDALAREDAVRRPEFLERLPLRDHCDDNTWTAIRPRARISCSMRRSAEWPYSGPSRAKRGEGTAPSQSRALHTLHVVGISRAAP